MMFSFCYTLQLEIVFLFSLGFREFSFYSARNWGSCFLTGVEVFMQGELDLTHLGGLVFNGFNNWINFFVFFWHIDRDKGKGGKTKCISQSDCCRSFTELKHSETKVENSKRKRSLFKSQRPQESGSSNISFYNLPKMKMSNFYLIGRAVLYRMILAGN